MITLIVDTAIDAAVDAVTNVITGAVTGLLGGIGKREQKGRKLLIFWDIIIIFIFLFCILSQSFDIYNVDLIGT